LQKIPSKIKRAEKLVYHYTNHL